MKYPSLPTVLTGAPQQTPADINSVEEMPMRETFLPFCLPEIGEQEIEEVVQTLRSGWISTGPRTKRFEQRFAEYVGARNAIALNSGTAALHVSLAACDIGPGDEVITSPMTFCATANVIVHLGATPVFADIGPDYNIDPDEVEKHISPRTKAILPVHHSGQACRMDEILECARQHNLIVIEDAAHAAGATYRTRKVGTIGDATAFSFYATKNMTTAEGGMVTTEDDQLADKMRILSLHGMSKDAWQRYTRPGSWYYEVLCAGFKYNMTDIQAALGIHQLAKLERFIAIRTRYARMYDEAFAEVPEVNSPFVWPDVGHAWHLYVIQLDLERLTIDRAQFIEALRDENVGASVHFIPVHLHPYYRQTYGYHRGDFPNAELIYDRMISLPLYTRMTEQDVASVVAAVKKIVRRHRRVEDSWSSASSTSLLLQPA